MRKLLIFIVLFLLHAAPAVADATQSVDVKITIETIFRSEINNGAAINLTWNEFNDFDITQDIGDVTYDLSSNRVLQFDALILDGPQGGQTADNWGAATWLLSVNDVTVNESSGTTVDSYGPGVIRDDNFWEVLLKIPGVESVSTDCTIQITVSVV